MNFFLLIVFFLFTFGPVVNKIGQWFDVILLMSVLITSWGFIKYGINRLPIYIASYFVLVPLFVVVASFAALEYGITTSIYFQLLLRPLRILFTLLAGFFLVLYLFKTEKNFAKTVLLFLYLSIAIHAAIMAIQMHSIPFKDFIYSYTTTGGFRSTFEYDFRMGGLSGGSGGAVLSVVQATGLTLLPFLLKFTKTKLESFFYIVLGFIIFYSILICGRSGLWNIILFFPIAVVLSDSKFNIVKFIKLIFALAIVIFVFTFIVDFTQSLDEDSPISHALGRTLDTFIRVDQGEGFSDNTVNVLQDHLLLPDNFRTLLIGNPEHLIFTQFDRTLDSDIGYIRNLWSMGLVGTLLFIWPAIKSLRLAWSTYRTNTLSRLFILVACSMFFFHSKESFMYTRMLLSIYSVLLALWYFNMIKLTTTRSVERKIIKF